MTNYTKHFSARQTPQSQPIPGSNQVRNNAGGYSFAVDNWTRLQRFLILGSEGGNYYASERKLTEQNANAVLACIRENGTAAVQRIVEVSRDGRAPKNSPAIFALALAAAQGDTVTKQAAYAAVNEVCRIGTHLFEFANYCQQLRGWGSGLRRAVANWYTARNARDLAYQVTKYQSRSFGANADDTSSAWSHRDLLRLAHPNGIGLHNTIFHYITKGWEGVGEAPHPEEALLPIWAFERAKRATSESEIVSLINKYRLVRECIPTQMLNSPAVWEALLTSGMPMNAMVRNLGKMTSVGLLAPFSQGMKTVVAALSNKDYVQHSKLHPVAVLTALKVYAQGHGDKGKLHWTPVPQVVDALDGAFYTAFGNVEPTNLNWMLGIDVSGSMNSPCGKMGFTCCEGATAMALVTAHIEPNYSICAFNHGLTQLPFSKNMRLDNAMRYTLNINGGGTDCSLPILAAMQNQMNVDVFMTITDCETWAGHIHPMQALRQYRERFNPNAKLIVCGMLANSFSIADPTDRGALDVVGFDAATPQIMSEFALGNI